MMHPAIAKEDWSLMDFVDLETSLTGVAMALEVSGPGQLRDDQMGVYKELGQEVGTARGLGNKLRAKHLEKNDLLGIPVAAANPSDISEKLRTEKLRFDTELSAGKPGRTSRGQVPRGWIQGQKRIQGDPAPLCRALRPGRSHRKKPGQAMVLRSARRPPVVQASMGGSREALPS